MSGGTTGTPKGVLGTHGAYVIDRPADAGVDWHRSSSRERQRHHAAAAACSTSTPTSACRPGVRHRQPDRARAQSARSADLLATIRRVKPAFFNGVPTLYVALLNHPDVQSGKVDFKSIKICFSGAAPLMADTKQRFESMTGGRIVEGYSLTEAMMALCVNPVKGPNKLGSVGMPLPDVARANLRRRRGVTARCRRARSARSASPAPQLMSGFWNRPDETASVLREHVDDDGAAALAAHRRSRLPRRGRLPVHRRSQEGPDQDQRLSGVAAGGRGGAGGASGGRGGRRRRRAGRVQGRSRQGLGGPARRARRRPKRSCARSAASGWRRTRSRRSSSSGRSCPRRWSARCCAGR